MSEINRGAELRINLVAVGNIYNTAESLLSAGTRWEEVQGVLKDKFRGEYQNELEAAFIRLRREKNLK